eukprot:symbB.v1.2.006783.t1/scaffold396.1/size242164/10
MFVRYAIRKIQDYGPLRKLFQENQDEQPLLQAGIQENLERTFSRRCLQHTATRTSCRMRLASDLPARNPEESDQCFILRISQAEHVGHFQARSLTTFPPSMVKVVTMVSCCHGAIQAPSGVFKVEFLQLPAHAAEADRCLRRVATSTC